MVSVVFFESLPWIFLKAAILDVFNGTKMLYNLHKVVL